MGVVGAELLVRFWVDGYDVRRCLGGSRGSRGQMGWVFFEEGAIVGVAAALGAGLLGLWFAAEEGEEAHDCAVISGENWGNARCARRVIEALL